MAPLPALVALLPGIPLVPPPALEPAAPPPRSQPASQPASRPAPLAPGQGDWLEINGWPHP